MTASSASDSNRAPVRGKPLLNHNVKRGAAGLAGLAGAFGIYCILYALTHMRAWEWPRLYAIVGVRGIVWVMFLVGGLVALTWHCSLRALIPAALGRRRVWFKVLMIAWVAGLVWMAEWCYIEEPPTVAIRNYFIGPREEAQAEAAALKRYRADGSIAAIKEIFPGADERRLAIMFARIAVNQPTVFEHVSIGRIIGKYAKEYGVSPLLLLDECYTDSIYGKSPSGPMPFFAGMNVQLFRHLVQMHLPSWLIEGRFRRAMAEGRWLTTVAGQRLGTKLRYGAQKATYDVEITPYQTNIMSDLLLVMQQYPQQFPELLGPDASRDPLARSFLALRGNALLEPYDQPYSHAPRDAAYYDEYRSDLISFARAAVYRLSGDFDFATRVQALVARYHADQYAKKLGPARWAALSERQQTALFVMARDVYTPNIGHLSYNLYMLPELNDSSIEYVGTEAAEHYDEVQRTDRIWIPPHRDRLWGATYGMLDILSEVWGITTGTPLAGVRPYDTTESDLKVLVRNHSY